MIDAWIILPFSLRQTFWLPCQLRDEREEHYGHNAVGAKRGL